MSKPVSVDYQFSIQQRGRGAKKQIFEGEKESNKTLESIPRIARYMALAIHFEDLIRRGVVTDYADLARLGHVTRARVTQIMNLRLLAPEIQEELLFLQRKSKGEELIPFKWLQSLAGNSNWQEQRRQWQSGVAS